MVSEVQLLMHLKKVFTNGILQFPLLLPFQDLTLKWAHHLMSRLWVTTMNPWKDFLTPLIPNQASMILRIKDIEPLGSVSLTLGLSNPCSKKSMSLKMLRNSKSHIRKRV
jgi:hypothetical protein